MNDSWEECCASESCEVCCKPQGYAREHREHLRQQFWDYDPPWVQTRVER